MMVKEFIYYENGTSYKGKFSEGEITDVEDEISKPKPIENNAKKDIDNLINSLFGIAQPLGKLIGINVDCGNCHHSTDDHFHLEGTIWQYKKCGQKCNNKILS